MNLFVDELIMLYSSKVTDFAKLSLLLFELFYLDYKSLDAFKMPFKTSFYSLAGARKSISPVSRKLVMTFSITIILEPTKGSI